MLRDWQGLQMNIINYLLDNQPGGIKERRKSKRD
jgi:hypothetical protein